MGVITGICVLGSYLVIFFTKGIVVGTNTGSYGAFQFTFQKLSSSVGMVAPRSLVLMDGYAAFYGGDRFYCTDGSTLLAPLPDELPTFYNGNAKSARPTIIKVDKTVFGVRHYDEIIWSFDSTGTGVLDQQIVFNQSANQNWAPGQLKGGAWSYWNSGMPINCAYDCRGPGDIGQLFWGSSITDTVAQHDAVTTTANVSAAFSDFGNPINIEIRAKSFFLEKPVHIKLVQSLYVLAVFDTQNAGYTVSLTPYIYFDSGQQFAVSPVNFNVAAGGTLWGTEPFGSFVFESATLTAQSSQKAYFNNQALGLSISPGLTENSTFPVNIIGFVIEATIDEPQP
jgi:hypothetical protein